MCVAFWSLEHPAYALILCTNRDEYLTRPTEPAHFHNFGPLASSTRTSNGANSTTRDDQTRDSDTEEGYVLSGRDLLAGGTWLGINRSGRLAILTNITEQYAHYESSRGTLLSDFLLAPQGESLDEYVAELEGKSTAYAGFNLLLLSPTTSTSPPSTFTSDSQVPAFATESLPTPSTPEVQIASTPAIAPATEPQSSKMSLSYLAALVTNSGGGRVPLTARPLHAAERACGGLSNGVDGHGADAWPKVVNGVTQMRELLKGLDVGTGQGEREEEEDEKLVEALMDILSSEPENQPTARQDLRTAIHVAPLPLTPLTGLATPYGTRLSTVVLVRRDGRVLFVERDVWKLDDAGQVVRCGKEGERVWRFRVEVK